MSAAALLRQAGVPATQTMWAEDGAVFYSDALTRPLWQDIVRTYNGYGQLFPRLAVELTRLAPQRDASAVIAVAGAVTMAALGCIVFHMSRAHISSPALRALLVASMPLLPVATVELLNNLVNVPWWLLFTAFWALLWRPHSPGGKVLAGLVCFLAVGSDPLVGLLLPLAAVRLVALPDVREQAPTAGLVAGLAWQGAVVLFGNGGQSFKGATFQGVPSAFAVRVGLEWIGGKTGTERLFAGNPTLATALGAALICTVVLAGLLARQRPEVGARTGPGYGFAAGDGYYTATSLRAFSVAAAVCAAACFAVPVWLRGVGPAMQASAGGFAARYEAAPVLMLLSAVLAGVNYRSRIATRRDDSGRGRSSGRYPARHLASCADTTTRAWIAAGVCAALLVPGWAVDFRNANGRSRGPTWQSQLVQAAAFCHLHGPTSRAVLAIDPPGRFILLPCPAIDP